jgi:hypothetical protein
MDTKLEPNTNKGRKYVVGGKEWIVGERKISMFSKAKTKDKAKKIEK